jgi:hypothetical protein
MVVGFMSTYTLSAFHLLKVTCFDSRPWWGVLETNLFDKFVSDKHQLSGFLQVISFPPFINMGTMK